MKYLSPGWKQLLSIMVLRKAGIGCPEQALSQPGDAKLNPRSQWEAGGCTRTGAGCSRQKNPCGKVGGGGDGVDRGHRPPRLQGLDSKAGAHPETGTVRREGGTGVTLLYKNPHVVQLDEFLVTCNLPAAGYAENYFTHY